MVYTQQGDIFQKHEKLLRTMSNCAFDLTKENSRYVMMGGDDNYHKHKLTYSECVEVATMSLEIAQYMISQKKKG